MSKESGIPSTFEILAFLQFGTLCIVTLLKKSEQSNKN